MSFWLEVDAARWRGHADAVRDAVGRSGALVPVAKGNGYGLGLPRLARESARLGAGAIAVGTVHEIAAVAPGFAGDVLVMTPFEPADTVATEVWQGVPAAHVDRVVRTVASPDGLRAAISGAGPGHPIRVVVEALTSTGRFGLDAESMRALLADETVRAALDAGALLLEGLALHLPMAQPDPGHRAVPGAGWHDVTLDPVPPVGATERVREVLTWARGWGRLLADLQAGAPSSPTRPVALERAPTLWLSHLTDDELSVLAGALPDVPLRLRVGTRLWLGERSALQAYGCVLAAHPLRRGDRSGYRQRRASRDGVLLVVGGGTAHGVALVAPSPVVSVRQRLLVAGSGALEAGGRSLSPFRVDGHQRWFAEPPHMHVSLLRLPPGGPVPAVGDRVPCEVRLTTASFDRVLGLD